MIDENPNKILKTLKYISFSLFIMVVLWLSLVLIELYRVKNEKRPFLCYNEIKEVEDDDEYSKTCYGVLYKYREYFYTETNKKSASEFTLAFKEFARNKAK